MVGGDGGKRMVELLVVVVIGRVMVVEVGGVTSSGGD